MGVRWGKYAESGWGVAIARNDLIPFIICVCSGPTVTKLVRKRSGPGLALNFASDLDLAFLSMETPTPSNCCE
jgi:hypothetical protein